MRRYKYVNDSTLNNASSSGIGFSGLLQITFIVLKLCGVINWSWWWVLSPSIISTGLVLLIVMLYGIWLIITVIKEKL